MDEYQLRGLPKRWDLISVDDLYHILFYHQVYDNTECRDELQRCYVDTGILMASYFGCRPVSMFDNRINFEEEDDARKPADPPTIAGHPENHRDNLSDQDDADWDDEQATLFDSASDLDRDGDSSARSNDDDGDGDGDTDSGTNHGVDAGLDDTKSLLWRHITFFISAHRVCGETNFLFAKVMITYTKGEDSCPRYPALRLSPPHLIPSPIYSCREDIYRRTRI